MSEPKRSAASRAARFVGREIGHVMGFEHVKQGSHVFRQQWKSVTRRVCPACEIGKLYPFSETIEGEIKQFVGCSHCDHYQAVRVNDDPATQTKLRAAAQRKIDAMGETEFRRLIHKYRLGSRLLYVFSLLVFAFSVYLLVVGGSAWTFLNACMGSVFLFVRGLIASYRYWQLSQKRLFVAGAFRRWFWSGTWFV